MQIDFSKVLTDLSGKPLTEDGTPNGKPATLGAFAITALLATYADEQPSAIEKVERFQLANLIYSAGESAPLSVEAVVLIKRLIGQMYPPLIVGQAFALLDSAT